jgi:hypothetical protein
LAIPAHIYFKMVFSVKSFVPLLLAGAAVANPVAKPAASRLRRHPSPASFTNNTGADTTAETIGTYTFPTWSGAFLDTTDVTSVTGTFTVPTPSLPDGGDSSTAYCGCAWVGIDGVTNFCSGGLMQAGVNWCIEDGVPSYSAWYEWWPAEAQQTYDDISVTAGDQITVTIDATSTTGGTATLENLSNGQSSTFTWTGESPALCEVTAEWIVEDFTVGDSPVPFANYGSVTFTGNSAVVGGNTVDLSNAYLANMVPSGSSSVVSLASVDGDDITCTYQ